jgi:hypothetical protein
MKGMCAVALGSLAKRNYRLRAGRYTTQPIDIL